MAKAKKFDAAEFAARYKAQLDTIGRGLLCFDVPAQRTINCGFAMMGEARFVGKDDRWEQVTAYQAGREYEAPPARLIARWRLA